MKVLWLVVYFAVLAWSAIDPRDYFTWALEVAPAILALLVLAATRQRFPLSSLSYGLILVHCVILMIGGHYTYAEVPLFDSLAQTLGGTRNNYDKLGHFAQGFVPAMVAREVLLRLRVLRPGAWCAFLVVCFALAVSALYEIIEWAVAVITGTAAERFLGTQGYVWDTQSDMAMALLGAVTALVLLTRVQDKQLRRWQNGAH